MKRKKNSLVPLEASILSAGLELRMRGNEEFHGYALAKAIREQENARTLKAHGTLYRALERLRQAELVEARWEDPLVAEEEARPRRRLYRVTPAGEAKLAEHQRMADRTAPEPRPRTMIPCMSLGRVSLR